MRSTLSEHNEIIAHTLNQSRCVQDMFRFYIFTMGDKTYAETMAQLLDPETRHFRDRIVNRSDAISSSSGRSSPTGRHIHPHQMVKTLQQVGISGHVATVLDDTSGERCSPLVWLQF